MIKLLLKNNFTIWVKWILHAKKVRKRFPDTQIGFMTKLRGKSELKPFSTIDNHVMLENTSVGEYSYVGTEVRLNYTSVGKYCSIGPGVYAGLGVHPTSTFVSTSNRFYTSNPGDKNKPYFEDYKNTIIGNDVWIGAGTILIDGVKIGNGAVIGAGAVVTKDVPPYAVAVGIPAKVIKYRFNEEEINFLQEFNWWDKDRLWIEKNTMLFGDIKEFMRLFHKPGEQKSPDQVLPADNRSAV